MSSQGFRETVAGSSKLLMLVLRHILVAPLVSFVTSFVSVFFGIFFIVLFGQHLGRAMCFTFVGFCGVFSGACVLPQRTRGLSSICLTALGMIYYAGFIAEWGGMMTDEGKFVDVHDRSLAELILLGFGGLLATALLLWSSSAMLQRMRQKGSILTLRSHHLIRRAWKETEGE